MPRRRLRIGFVLLGTVGSLVGLVSVALCGFVGFVKTDGGNAWLTSKVDTALDGLVTDGEVTIVAIHTDLWGHFRFE
ncbi:MAG: hypothetical protein H0V89_02160, partial [Deltaproteobacteria bacterium]|nr:hypothetical protein [Deltaproteobacteria bacterium]